ncbi:ABC transporter permease subunit [Chloroflexi bacterium TSY]|nr:ABC transporter permease subunit [Chloroflexi bacterium TSY]
MGRSLTVFQDMSVSRMLMGRLSVSMQIGALSLLALAVLDIPLGIIAAYRHNTWLDYGIVSLAAVIQTVPVFVLAPLFMLFSPNSWALSIR